MAAANDDVRTLVVGPHRLGDEELVQLSQAAAVVGPRHLVDAVGHLCPPTVRLLPDGSPDEAPRPTVLLVAGSGDRDA